MSEWDLVGYLDSLNCTIDCTCNICTITKLKDTLSQKDEQIKKLKDALSFYAHNFMFGRANDLPSLMDRTDLDLTNSYGDYYCYQGGKLARKTLKELEEV